MEGLELLRQGAGSLKHGQGAAAKGELLGAGVQLAKGAAPGLVRGGVGGVVTGANVGGIEAVESAQQEEEIRGPKSFDDVMRERDEAKNKSGDALHRTGDSERRGDEQGTGDNRDRDGDED